MEYIRTRKTKNMTSFEKARNSDNSDSFNSGASIQKSSTTQERTPRSINTSEGHRLNDRSKGYARENIHHDEESPTSIKKG